MTTAATITAPEMPICQNGETSMIGSAFLTTPRNRAPSTAPATLPIPPAMLIPPITQAAITWSSKPIAIST